MASDARDDWDEHWTDHAQANELNPAQDFRRRLCLRLLAPYAPIARLLDIGSGLGQLIGDAHERWPAAEMLGIELSQAGVDSARARYPHAAFEVVDLLATTTPLEGRAGWATHAVCSEVLEHVDDPVALLTSARGWLAPGAVLVVTVPGGPMSAFDRHIGHRRHFTADDIGAVLRRAGFAPLRCAGAGFPFFNLYRASGDRSGRRAGAGRPRGRRLGRRRRPGGAGWDAGVRAAAARERSRHSVGMADRRGRAKQPVR